MLPLDLGYETKQKDPALPFFESGSCGIVRESRRREERNRRRNRARGIGIRHRAGIKTKMRVHVNRKMMLQI